MRSLVIGASGFLGSHVVHDLVARGESVRALVRAESDTRGIDGLDVERVIGDIFDPDSIRAAISGCDVVYYCVVDARPWLRDPTPMWRTNVEGLRGVLDIAAAAHLRKFVFTSSVVTIGIPDDGRPATEEIRNNWLSKGGEYARTRVAAEDLVLEYRDTHGLPAVAMCVANTYGAGDFLPTPHGGMVKAAVRQKMPFCPDGVGAEVVGIEDAARAMTLAADRGRPGQRYIIAERFMSTREIFETACAAAGVAPPKKSVSLRTLNRMALAASLVARVRGQDSLLTPTTVRLMHIMPRMDHGKAVGELGWEPSPTPEAIVAAAHFYVRR